MLDKLQEFTLPIAAAADIAGVHFTTTHRWATIGCRGVKLETLRVGSRLFTSEAALERFLVEVNQEPAERAEAELSADGC